MIFIMKLLILLPALLCKAYPLAPHVDGPQFSVYKWSETVLNGISRVVSTNQVIAGIDSKCMIKVKTQKDSKWSSLGNNCAQKLYIKSFQNTTFLFQIENKTGNLMYATFSANSGWTQFQTISQNNITEVSAEISASKKV